MATTPIPSHMATQADLSLDAPHHSRRSSSTPRAQQLTDRHRRYAESAIEWPESVKCLGVTGELLENPAHG